MSSPRATPPLPEKFRRNDLGLVHSIECVNCGANLFTVDLHQDPDIRRALLARKPEKINIAINKDKWQRVRGHVVTCGCGARNLTAPDPDGKHPLGITHLDVSTPIVDKVDKDEKGRLRIVGRFLSGSTLKINGEDAYWDALPEWPATVVTLEVKNEHGADARWHTVWPQAEETKKE